MESNDQRDIVLDRKLVWRLQKMGTWGFKLYQNDTALDIKDEFEKLFNAGKAIQQITDELIEDYKNIMGDPDEEPLFWLALADTQWNFGVLLPVVKEKALYWINKDIWRMSVDAERVPVRPFLKYRDTKYYGLTVSPKNGDVYVADAIDYQQQGMIYRYTKDGELVDEFYVGIIPGAFCWK